MNILLGVTGSVAATLTAKTIKALSKFGEVRVITTKHGKLFLEELNMSSNGPIQFYTDEDEWLPGYMLGDKVLHIELRKWADVLVVAPLSANTLAKFANGLCDNLLTCVYRAWDFNTKPVIVAPAMNTYMWQNSITYEHIEKIGEQYVNVIDPIEKTLACGDTGVGAMAHIDDIVKEVDRILTWYPPIPFPAVKYLPTGDHPGAFGTKRKHDTHTGVDLYTLDGRMVYAVEDGVVVDVSWFTGPKADYPWWEDTQAVMIEGISGVVLYGEITTKLNVGDVVSKSGTVGWVKRVLPKDKLRKDIVGHSTSMLHIELYEKGYRGPHAIWIGDRPPCLLDPTDHLRKMGQYKEI